jgi:hypothetical protein
MGLLRCIEDYPFLWACMPRLRSATRAMASARGCLTGCAALGRDTALLLEAKEGDRQGYMRIGLMGRFPGKERRTRPLGGEVYTQKGRGHLAGPIPREESNVGRGPEY